MKKIIISFILTLFIINGVHANIVDQLTELNNLYKSGALNEDEFSKAKNLLLKSETDEKVESEEKKPVRIIEIKATKENLSAKDLSKTFISKEELEYIDQYKKINQYPVGLFKNSNFSESMLAKKSAQEMYKTFVQHKNLNSSQPTLIALYLSFYSLTGCKNSSLEVHLICTRFF